MNKLKERAMYSSLLKTTPIDQTESHIHRDIAWGTVALFFITLTGFGGLLAVLMTELISPIQAIPLSTLLIYLSFTVLHEAGHRNISQGVRWMLPIERLMGWVSAVPFIVIPFSLFARIHDYHHAFTNDPDRDPDYWVSANSWFVASVKSLFLPICYILHTAKGFSYDPVIKKTLLSSLTYWLGIGTLVIVLVTRGAGEILLVAWVVPIVIASYVLAMLFDWIPHTPNLHQNKYLNTRIYTAPVVDFLTLGQSYHLVHHLYPRIPWYAYKRVFGEIKHDLEKHNAPIEGYRMQHVPELFKASSISTVSGSGKYTFEVENVIQEARNTVRIVFNKEHIKGFTFTAGQYITLGKQIGHEYVTRCYSICSSVNDSELCVAVKKVPNGKMSRYLNDELEIGDKLTVAGPFGDFVFQSPENIKTHRVVLIAGGSGITPIISILKSVLETSNKAEVDLIYCCRSLDEAAFIGDIKSLERKHKRQLSVKCIVSQEGEADADNIGRLNSVSLIRYLKESCVTKDAYCFICGPASMNDMAIDALHCFGISGQHIFAEKFQLKEALPNGPCHEVVIKTKSGGLHCLSVAENQTVLEVARQHGVNLPSACGVGQCGCCLITLKKGKEHYVDDDAVAILPSERKSGKTLACQCQPRSDLLLEEIH